MLILCDRPLEIVARGAASAEDVASVIVLLQLLSSEPQQQDAAGEMAEVGVAFEMRRPFHASWVAAGIYNLS